MTIIIFPLNHPAGPRLTLLRPESQVVGLLWCGGLPPDSVGPTLCFFGPAHGPTHLSQVPEQRVEGQGTPRLLMAFACIVFLPAPYISALKTGNATECSSRFQSGGEKRGGDIRTKQPLIKQPVISGAASGEFTKLFFFFLI